ncbi:MAG: inorganic pyrophosphatase [Anaerolineae bacterium]|nr:inorganic pyrophosphatase [Anaerolineae bacterium]
MSHPPDTFWAYLDRLVAESEIVIDRPAGSAHPRYPDFIYPHPYGYLDGTQSMDGGGVDVWVGSLPEKRVVAIVSTVNLEKRDAEVKLLIGCTAQEMQTILKTHNWGLQAGVLIERP